MKFLKHIIVRALILESRLILAKYKPFIVAITGSVGKTSTKDAIYNVLKTPALCTPDGRGICYVRKSEKSLNSEIGLPLTVIGVPNAWRNVGGWLRNLIAGLKLIVFKCEYPDCLVLEIGADHPGDISSTVRWLRPDISVITQVSNTPVHVEFFASPEDVFEEKASLATAVKNDGALILFADNSKVLALADRVSGRNVNVVSFGMAEHAMVRGSSPGVTYGKRENESDLTLPTGFSFVMTINGVDTQISIPGIIGQAHVFPLLAAAATGIAKNVPMHAIVRGLREYDAPKGRMNIISGINHSTLIDDTYNSSPDAVVSALGTLKAIQISGQKIAVLGDMLELGQYAAEEHRKVGREVFSAAAILITVGPRSRATADEAIKAGFAPDRVRTFDTAVEAGEYVKGIVKSGDAILIKGSQSVRMERAVKLLMRDPDKASNLLIRQEPEWLEKK